PFLRFGTWIGGDRDGNPNVTAEVTRAALDAQRAVALGRALADADALGRELSVSARLVGPWPKARGGLPPVMDEPSGPAELDAAIAADRARFPEVAVRARRVAGREPWREKLAYVRARLEATRTRTAGAYP